MLQVVVVLVFHQVVVVEQQEQLAHNLHHLVDRDLSAVAVVQREHQV
jgi:hypothetical protein